MIITVPEYKKIQHISKKTSKLNESLFDDFDDDFDDETDLLSKNINIKYEETELKPRVERILDEFDVENYEIKCTGNGILVDVHDNLYLPNKGLNKFDSYLFHVHHKSFVQFFLFLLSYSHSSLLFPYHFFYHQ